MPATQSCGVHTFSGHAGLASSRLLPSGRASGRSGSKGAGRAGQPGARRRMLCLALLPASAIGVLGAALAGWAGRPYGAASAGGLSLGGGAVAGWLLLVCAVMGAAATMACREARLLTARQSAVRRMAAQYRTDLQGLVERMRRGERAVAPAAEPPPPPCGDALDQLSYEITLGGHAACRALGEAAALHTTPSAGQVESEQKIEVFVHLARRLQCLVHREIEHLDELEHEIEDPDLLRGLFQIDHLATRMRRHAENLAVLGGSVIRRQWSRPVAMTEVLRSCIAEVEHYARVRLVPGIEGTLRGHAVADVIHLLAELVENATVFSAPQSQVLLRAQRVTAGLAIEVEDRGLGMTSSEQSRMNAVLAGAEGSDIGGLLGEGRLGLFVVAALARRHHIVVRLQSNIYGGTQAVIVLPPDLLGEDTAQRYTRHLTAAAPVVVPAAMPPAGSASAVETAVSACGPSPAPDAVHAPASDSDARPQLPRRRRQEHLAPGLRDTPVVGQLGAGRAGGHDPGLLAAFRRGASLADGANDF